MKTEERMPGFDGVNSWGRSESRRSRKSWGNPLGSGFELMISEVEQYLVMILQGCQKWEWGHWGGGASELLDSGMAPWLWAWGGLEVGKTEPGLESAVEEEEGAWGQEKSGWGWGKHRWVLDKCLMNTWIQESVNMWMHQLRPIWHILGISSHQSRDPRGNTRITEARLGGVYGSQAIISVKGKQFFSAYPILRGYLSPLDLPRSKQIATNPL